MFQVYGVVSATSYDTLDASCPLTLGLASGLLYIGYELGRCPNVFIHEADEPYGVKPILGCQAPFPAPYPSVPTLRELRYE